MPPEIDTDLPQDPSEQTPETPTPPAIDPSQFVSREQYDSLVGQLAHLNGAVTNLVGQIGQAGMRQAPVEPDITDERLAEMIESGDGAQIVAAQRMIAQREAKALRAEMAQQYQGIVQLGTVYAERQLKGSMPEYHRDPQVKKDVDAMMNTLDPAARANPEAWELVYSNVLARPDHFQRIVDRRAEEMIRQRNGGAQVADPVGHPTAAARAQSKPGLPSAEEVFGSEFIRDLQTNGLTPDDLARRYGYANYEEYYKKTQIPDDYESQWTR